MGAPKVHQDRWQLLPASSRRPKYAPALFFRASDKPVLDLGVNIMKPFFSALGSFLMKPNFGL